MRVRTIRPHGNAYPPQYHKNRGRKYNVPDHAARNLIAARLVELDAPDEDKHED